jgi:hypothetical protein
MDNPLPQAAAIRPCPVFSAKLCGAMHAQYAPRTGTICCASRLSSETLSRQGEAARLRDVATNASWLSRSSAMALAFWTACKEVEKWREQRVTWADIHRAIHDAAHDQNVPACPRMGTIQRLALARSKFAPASPLQLCFCPKHAGDFCALFQRHCAGVLARSVDWDLPSPQSPLHLQSGAAL